MSESGSEQLAWGWGEFMAMPYPHSLYGREPDGEDMVWIDSTVLAAAEP